MIELKPLPPKEAIDFFRQKGYQIGFSYQDVWQAEHQAAFTVAKAMSLDVLKDIRAAVDDALANGTPFSAFRDDLKPLLAQKGWWGHAEMVDPHDREKKRVQLGSTRRLKVIYDTNLRTAHAEGQWARIQESQDAFPYLMYSGGHSAHPRHLHLSWNGLVLRADDPFWQAHMPVRAWSCKCRVIQQSEEMLSRSGRKVGTAPQVQDYTYINRRTGEVQKIPAGVDPAFHYPPGGRLANLPKFITDKVISAQADLGAAFWQDGKPDLLPGVRKDFSDWAASVRTDGTSRGKWRVAGVMDPVDVAFLAAHAATPQSAEIAIPDKLIVGKKAQRHADAGDALTAEEWAALPDGLADPVAVLYDTETGNLLYVFDSLTDPRAAKIVVQPDFVTKKPKTRVNMARAAFKVSRTPLAAGIKGGKYVVVRGGLE